MKDIMNNAGNIVEELEEADAINDTKTDGIFTFSAACGPAFTLFCC